MRGTTEAQRAQRPAKVELGENALSWIVIGSAIEVHRALGPGLLESAYDRCFARELRLRKIPYQRQVPVPLMYKGEAVPTALRIDYVIQSRVVVELKSVEAISALHRAQLLTYLKLTGHRLGLLLNFNAVIMRDGIERMANGL